MDNSGAPPVRDGPSPAPQACVFRKEGEYWTIVFEGRAIRLKDAKGLHCLAHLLRNPGREFHATDLVGVGEKGAEPPPGAADLGDAGEVLDTRAKEEYRRRLGDLREELAEAERLNDTGRAGRAREEIEGISSELAAGIGLGGRDRRASSHAERARVTVTQRVKGVVAKIRDAHPSLGRHLGASVKTGYFCSYDPQAPLVWIDEAESGPIPAEPASAGSPIVGRPPARFRGMAIAAGAVLLVLVSVYAARTPWLGRSIEPSQYELPLPDRPSIAILPFVNLTGDSEQEYFARGLTEDLITDASKVSGLFVIARDSVLPYAKEDVDVRDVARDLGVRYVLDGNVRYVLEGSVRKAGEELRITARLSDAASGRQLWAERYDRAAKDTFSLGDEILGHIVTDMQVEVKDAELERIRRVPTKDLGAYEAYLRGVDLSERCTVASVGEARQMFERAIDVDPDFAPAYAELGLLAIGEVFGPLAVHKLCASGVYGADRSARWPVLMPVVKRLGELGERAVSLDDSMPLAHVLNALLVPGTPQAITAADRAMRLGPNDARTHALSAAVYASFARPQDAIRLLEKATRLNPRSPEWYSFHLGRAYALAERYDDAIPALKRVAVAYPDFLWAHIELAAIYEKLGRLEEARLEQGEMQRLNPEMAAQFIPMPDGLEGMPVETDEAESWRDYQISARKQPTNFSPPRAPAPTAERSTDSFFRLQ
jgi:TolB-like protein